MARIAILRKSIRDIIYALEKHISEERGTIVRSHYAFQDVGDYVGVADAIKEYWVKLIHMNQFFVPRKIRSWDTSFEISYKNHSSAYDEAILDGFIWMQKIYCDRSNAIRSETSLVGNDRIE